MERKVRVGGLGGCEGVVGCFVGGPELCPRQVPGGQGCGGAGFQKRPAYVDCRRRLVARIGAGRLGAKAACGRLGAHLLVALELTELLGALASRLVRRAGPLTLGPGVWWRGWVGWGWQGAKGGGMTGAVQLGAVSHCTCSAVYAQILCPVQAAEAQKVSRA